jgi:hypothetical protein
MRSALDPTSPVLRPTPGGMSTHDIDERERPPMDDVLSARAPRDEAASGL